MNNKLAKILSALMIATALLGFAAIIPTFAQAPYQPLAYVVVSPQVNSFPPPSMVVGSLWSFNVSIENCTGIAGVSFHITWDPTLLNCTSMTEVAYHTWTPSAYQTNLWNLGLSYNNTGGYADYSWTWMDLTSAASNGYAPANATMVTNPSTNGVQTLAAFTMQVLMLPTMAIGNVSCPLTLSAVKVSDMSGAAIIAPGVGNAPVSGSYILYWSPPTILPYYSVSPTTYTATTLYQLVNINVLVNNLDAGWEAVGFQFTLTYDPTMLSLVSVTPGPWLYPYGAPPDQGILNLTAPTPPDDSGTITVGEVVLPMTNGTWYNGPGMNPFPSSGIPGGILATLTFNATEQGVFPTTYSCALTLSGTEVSNWLSQPIGQAPVVNGFYTMAPLIVGRSIDIYTQWPAPYGGQGLNNPSDMFWPQKEVTLFANVSYNGWPEQGKDVAFQVIAPSTSPMPNQTWTVLYARTGADGIANVTFRLPWPCDHPEQWFGVWTVIGTVDIACTIVNDTLQFHYDYLVDIFKVTVDQPSYNHIGNANATTTVITATITYGTHLEQVNGTYIDPQTGYAMDLSNLTVVLTAFDNVQVPFGEIVEQIPFTNPIAGNSTIQTYPVTGWCYYTNNTVYLTVTVPKYAVPGPGYIQVAILNTWPYSGGTVISGYLTDPSDPVTSQVWLPYCQVPIVINDA
jgi:hypothetical protein